MSSSVLKKLIQPHSQAVAAVIGQTALPSSETDMLETLSIVVEQCPVAIAMFDRDMKYLLANRQWVREFNLTRSLPLIGKCQYDVFPKLHSRWREIYERALKGYAMRCEHPVQPQNGGPAISVLSEVKPWRQKRDVSVGGVVVMCHKLGAAGELAARPETDAEVGLAPVSISEVESELPRHEGFDFGVLPLPIYVVDGEGHILQANPTAMEQSLSQGLVVGETTLWEVLEGGNESGTLQQSFFEKVNVLRGGAEVAPQVLTLRQLPTGEEAGEGAGKRRPCRWLIARLPGDSGHLAVVGLAGLSPFEAVGGSGVAVLPTPQPGPQTILAETQKDLAVAEAKRLERELFMAREAVARMEQKVRTMRQAEQVLIRREKQQQSVLDALPGGVLVLNEQGAAILQNGHLQKLFGRTIAEGERVEDWLGLACPDPQHREEVQRVWRQDVWRRQLTRTLSLVTTDGLLKEIELRPASLAENGLVVHFQDVTQQSRIDEQLCATESKFRTLFQDNPLPIVMTDKMGAIYDVNPPAEALLQRTKQELRRFSVDELLTTDSVGDRRDAIREMRQSGATRQRLTVTLAGEAGAELNLTLSAITMAEGEVHSLLHFFETPVPLPTVEKEADLPPPGLAVVAEAVQEDERSQVEDLPPPEPVAVTVVEPVLLIATNVNGRIVRWTAEAEERFGFAEDEALQQPLHLLFQPSDASGFYAGTLVRAVAAGEVHWPFFGHHGARGEVCCEVRQGPNGGAQVELWEAREVERLVEPSVTPPAEPPAPDVADEALPLRPDWALADLSREQVIISETHHRINHHLSILASLLNVQSHSINDASARDALKTSQNRLRAMAALHSHLEQVSKSQGKGLMGFVADLVAHLRSSFGVTESQVAVNLAISEGFVLPKEWMMPLTMSLNEALSNAFEHAFPEGTEGQVTVELGGEGSLASLTVEDNGVGLAGSVAELAERGMGLKILALFADQMRGKLEVVNLPEKGTKVKMQFFIAFTDN